MTTGGDDTAGLRRRLDAAESLGRMTMSVAHDLRNVIAAIGAQTALLLDGLPAGSPLRRRGEAVRRATSRGERLTRELLAAGRPQPLTSAVADLNRVVSAVVRTLAPLLGDEVEVRMELDPRVGAVAVGAAALEQVAINLILNARDAMPGGGRVTIRTAGAAHANGAGPEPPALLRVEDTGAGMDEATRARAFEPYFTTKAAGTGTGLGLTTVYDIVTRHGGHAEIASEPGRGTTLAVIVPRVGGAADAGQGAHAARVVEILRRVRPDVRVLYLADRAEDASAGISDPTLVKPFSVDALVGKVREVLRELTGCAVA